MSTQTNTRGGSTVSTEFYLPAMPKQSGKPGRIERFVRGLDKGPRPE